MADGLASSGLMLRGNKQDGLAWIAVARSRRLQTYGMNTGSMHGLPCMEWHRKKGLVNPARPDTPETWVGS